MASWVRAGAGFALLRGSPPGCVEGCFIRPPFPTPFFAPGVLLISLWGCSWRPRSVGNDARSFNYRSRRTSVRKADRKKKDRIGGEASSFPPSSSLPIWTGGARKLKREPNIARPGGEAGNIPPLCNQLFLETFFSLPFFHC